MTSIDEFKRLRAEALDFGAPLAIDLTYCKFIDSLGLAGITEAFLKATETGQGFALVGSHPQVVRVLSLTGATDAMPCFDHLEEAIAHLRP